MNFKMMIAVLAAGACLQSVYGADPMANTTTKTTPSTTTITNATTIAASSMISPGTYTASVVPGFNSDMAGRLKKAVGKIDGIKSVTASAEASTIHFTVKNGASVRVADIQSAVRQADNGAVMSAPILEHSMTANPGL